jgi:hypothetical protein
MGVEIMGTGCSDTTVLLKTLVDMDFFGENYSHFLVDEEDTDEFNFTFVKWTFIF